MQTAHQPDDDLLERLRSGDADAFSRLVTDLNGRLLALARTFTRQRSLAEDIVQETWLAAIRGLPHFEGRSSVRAWIFSILVRRARTLTAREARQPESRSPDDAKLVEWEPGRGKIGLWEGVPTPWELDDPASIFQSREAFEVVRRALEEMPDRQRQVLLLRDVEDMAPSEVCNILGLSETNLRVTLHRARARVRRALDEYVQALPGRARNVAVASGGAELSLPQTSVGEES